MKKFAYILIFFGLFFYAVGIFEIWQRTNPNNLSFQHYKQSVPVEKVTQQSLPVRVIIKNLNIDLPIYTATIKNTVWDTTTLGANFLVLSPIPGNKGNSIIYAHNWLTLFGNLTLAKPGDEIEIQYADETKKIFVIQHTQVISPKESSVINPTKDTRLTMYTCTGFLDSKRFVVVAFPKG